MAAHRRAARCRYRNPNGVHIGYGFATKKYWSRHLVIAMFILIIVYASILRALNLIHYAIMWRAIVNGALFGGASVWYFYFKSNVAAYFRELDRR